MLDFRFKCISFNPGKAFWGAQVGETQCLAHASRIWGPAPVSFLASTAAPFESNSSAAATRPLPAARCSGVEPQALFPGKTSGRCGLPAVRWRGGRCAVGGQRKWWECWALYSFNRQRNVPLRSGKTQLCQTFAANANMFLRSSSPKLYYELPQVRHKIFTNNCKHTQQVSIKILFPRNYLQRNDVFKYRII